MAIRGARSLAAEVTFRAQLKELGATLLEPEWLGARIRHRAICAAGHSCGAIPHEVNSGRGICKTCVGHDPADAERRFRERVAELGGEVLEVRWLGAAKKHHVRCAAGHDAYPRPASVQQGTGICWSCSGRHPGVAEAEFRTRVEALGGTPAYTVWRGANHPHHVKCSAGHNCYPAPASVQQGQGICRACVGLDPAAAEEAYCALVISLGGTPLWDRWRGNKAPTLVRCPQGHTCRPRPNDVQQGSGLCRECAGAHSVFYVLEHDTQPVVKFGVSNRDGRKRLAKHRGHGYVEVHRLVADLPEGAALAVEDAVKSALALAGEKPVRGWEYFDASCLALILDVADSWLATPEALAA